MKINKQATPEAIIAELGQRIAQRRIEMGITQAQAAEQAGLGKRTIERIESGGDTQLSTLIRLLRLLDMVDALEQLIPKAKNTPLEMLKNQPKTSKRVKPRQITKPKKTWKWGDEK